MSAANEWIRISFASFFFRSQEKAQEIPVLFPQASIYYFSSCGKNSS